MKKTGLELIAEERTRQVTREGYSADHDDNHTAFELSSFAACHIANAHNIDFHDHTHYDGGGNVARFQIRLIDEEPARWVNGNPFDEQNLQDKTIIRNLVIAGALIAAEIDRLHRLGIE